MLWERRGRIVAIDIPMPAGCAYCQFRSCSTNLKEFVCFAKLPRKEICKTEETARVKRERPDWCPLIEAGETESV